MRSLAVLALAFLVAAPAAARRDHETLAPVPTPAPSSLQLLIDRFRLFPTAAERDALSLPASSRDRLFHLVGDPDALVTLGDIAEGNGYKLKAAVEMNDVVLHAIAPDERVKSTDTRQRAAGDYRALDGAGRPYQLRLGARLVW